MSNRLPRELADRAGAALGHDFSNVTVHEDGEADRLGTRAFARGNTLHFAAGTYNPSSPEGIALINHELGHVAQQREGRVHQDGTAGKVAVNTDPALEADADARGASVASSEPVAQGFSLDGFLAFDGGSKEVATPVAQGSDLAADEEPESAEESAEEEVVDVELADVLGSDYEASRDAEEEYFWESYGRLETLMGQIHAKSPGAAAELEQDLARSNLLPGEIHSLEEAVLSSARRGGDGAVIIDPAAKLALEDVCDELFAYGEVFTAEAKFWGLLVAVPMLELAEKLFAGWVGTLKNLDGSLQVAVRSRAKFEALYNKWYPELVEARAKTGIDVLTIFADVLLLTTPISGPIGFFGGLAVSLAGLAVGQLLEPDEKTQPQSIFNGIVTAADSVRQAHEFKAAGLPKFLSAEMIALIQSKGLATGKAIVSAELDVALKGLGTFLDAGSLVSDGSEMVIRQQMVDEITAALAEWNAQWNAMMKVWPDVVALLGAAVPFLDQLQAALTMSAPMLDAAWAEVLSARTLL